MKNKKWLSVAIASALLMSGCTGGEESSSLTESGASADTQQSAVVSDAEDAEVIDADSLFSDRDLEHEYLESNCSVITLDGSTAQCDSANVSISGSDITITAEGDYIIRGALTDGTITINCSKKEKVRLILDNAEINSSSNAAIYVAQADKVFITLAQGSKNVLSSSSFSAAAESSVDGAIFSKDDLTINGSGELKVTSSSNAIVSKNDLVITGGVFDLEAGNHALAGKDSVSIYTAEMTINSGNDGIHAENNDDATLGALYIRDGKYSMTTGGDGISAATTMQIDNGSFEITAGGGSSVTASSETSCKAVKSTGAMVLNGGTFKLNSADDAVHSDGAVTVTGGSFEIATGDDGFHSGDLLCVTAGIINISESYEGLEGLCIDISGGDITLIASDDGLNAAGGNDESGFGGHRGGDMFGQSSDSYINISGGTIRVNADGDGIDSNGALNVSGGATYISGPTNSANGALDYASSATVTGGIFLAAGAQQMAMNFSNAEGQGAALLTVGNQAAGTVVRLCDSSGAELINWTADKQFSSLAITCPEMQQGESYTLYCGDNSSEFTLSSLIYGSTGMGGFGNMGGFGDMGGFGGMGGGFGGGMGGHGGGMGGRGSMTMPDDTESLTPPEDFEEPTPPEGIENMTPPEGFEGITPPEGFESMTPPDGFEGTTPPDGFGEMQFPETSEATV